MSGVRQGSYIPRVLALAPLSPDARPLDAGERFALDLLVDLAGVLRIEERADMAAVQLRVTAEGVVDASDALSTLGEAPWIRIADGEIAIPRAALALVRDVAGGVAEQRTRVRDRHDRVPSTQNALVRAGGALEREPVVSRCALALGEAVRRAAGRRPALFLAPWPAGRRWAAALTHDLDVVDWWPAFTALRLTELLGKGELRRAARVVGRAVASGGLDVVWRGVREVLETEAAHDVRSTWFILCGRPTLATARAGDLTYRPDGRLARRILGAIEHAGHEIGLHGSFATTTEQGRFVEQRARLASLTGASVDAVRQHYLRLDPATTPETMQDAGFGVDSTVGFPDRNGFRLGVADVLPLWDDATGRTLTLDEAPFCWMDRALSKYRGDERPDAWIDDALALADRCRAVQGLFVGIWHPNLTPALGYPGASPAYRRLVGELVAREAHLATIGELVAWRRARRVTRATHLTAGGVVGVRAGTHDILIESATGARVDVER
jgi:peptidoglycan/xylan/chitin deacetylase (PgdA/CDA1 family)